MPLGEALGTRYLHRRAWRAGLARALQYVTLGAKRVAGGAGCGVPGTQDGEPCARQRVREAWRPLVTVLVHGHRRAWSSTLRAHGPG
jgi:hypothetical protein